MLEIGLARIDHHIVLKVNHLFEGAGLHVEQVAQTRGHCFEEPDMNDGSGQIDVPHPFSADATVGDFHATAVTNHALVFHAAVLAAGTFPVLFRTKDPLAEQTILFRPIGPVVDRFGLLDFTKRPALDVLRSRQRDADGRVVINAIVIAGFANRHD